ncbi:SNF2-related protein [Nitzschia inconspicua]|uniref:SNF2-related protein n=1 Tax=Nitzschia inconspicua TaxID=303405 RepID=A0A9K3KS13_9STRA|nr:SNF2-related protein [Nitzschia inconspicua]
MSAEAPIELLDSSDDEQDTPQQSPNGQLRTGNNGFGDGERGWGHQLHHQFRQKKNCRRSSNDATAAAAASSNDASTSSGSTYKPLASISAGESICKGISVPTKAKKRVAVEPVTSVPGTRPIHNTAAMAIPVATAATGNTTTAVTVLQEMKESSTRSSTIQISEKPTFKRETNKTNSSEDNQVEASATATTLNDFLDNDSDDDDDDFNDFVNNVIAPSVAAYDYQIDPPKPLQFMKHHCWACHEWIEHPTTLEQTAKPDLLSNEKIYCCYLMHEHPVLDVPVCVVCSEKIEDVVEAVSSPPTEEEDDSQERSVAAEADPTDIKDHTIGESSDNIIMTCGACGQEDSEDFVPVWLSCNNACGRVFCHHCVAQAHGNVIEVETMIRNHDSIQKWHCCACAPPDFLKQLQDYTRRLQKEADQMACAGDDDSSSFQPTQEGLDDIISYLQLVEDKKEECDHRLDRLEEDLEEIRTNCEQNEDLMELSTVDLEQHIQESQEEYRKGFEDQRLRLVDTIVTIEDILSAVYGIESRTVYAAIQGPENISGIQKAADDNPEWRNAADKVNAELEKEYFKGRQKKDDECDPNDARYRIEYADDIEDLGELDSSDVDDDRQGSDTDDSYKDYRAGWRQSRYLASQEAIDTAMEEEEKLYRKRNIKAKSCDRHEEKRDRRHWVDALKPVRRRRARRSRKGSRKSTTHTHKHAALTDLHKQNSHDDEVDSDSSDDGLEANTNGDIFSSSKPSFFVLSHNPRIVVASHFNQRLKKHQREGIEFMFKRTFADLGGDDNADIGGCILAHSMGLGKSLSVITLLHTLMFLQQQAIRKVLLVVPVNTVANWENEFSKWTEGIKEKMTIYNPGDGQGKTFRMRVLKCWIKNGGVFLISDALFRTSMKTEEMKEILSKPDAIFLDESHSMLKNKENQTFKELEKVKTKRRICLTGTPFQNNLLEYYRMISYARPGLLGSSEKKFAKEYAEPIYVGMAKDARRSFKTYADELIKKFTAKVDPFVHRRDATVLVNDLPSLQQVVLHVRPTKAQRALYALYRKYQKSSGQKNFFHQFSSLRPIHNHPAAIMYRSIESNSALEQENAGSKRRSSQYFKSTPSSKKICSSVASAVIDKDFTIPIVYSQHDSKPPPKDSKPSSLVEIIDLISDSEGEKENLDDVIDEKWITDDHWSSVFVNNMGSDLKSITNGNKCVLLLHILVHAQQLGEKTLVFSQCLRTLDYLSDMLAEKEWPKLVPCLQKSFPGRKMGGWRQGVDFLRIDGSTGGGERGELIKDFSADDNIKLFLISSLAGSLGINLTSASRCVLFDGHFNPTIDLQAIYRTYRYGQTRPVFCYRFLTQGSMEEKVYKRAVTKSGLAGRVIDGKTLNRLFNADELDSLTKVDDWVECDRCKHWRMVPPDVEVDVSKLPDSWYCNMMNEFDQRMVWSCNIPEKDAMWYHEHFKKANVPKALSNPTSESKGGIYCGHVLDATGQDKMTDEATKKLVERDLILKNLLTVSANEKQIVSKHYFHDALLSGKDTGILKGTESTVDP